MADLGSGLSPLALGLQQRGMQTSMVDLFDYPVDLNNFSEPARVMELLQELGVRVIKTDLLTADRLPFEDASLDRVSCIALLEHFHHSPRRFFAEVRRVLKAGGRVVIGCPNAVNLRKRVSVLLGRSNHPSIDAFWREGDPHWYGHVREPTIAELRWMTEAGGLRVVTSFGLNDIAIQNFGWLGRLADPMLRLAPGMCSDIYVIAEK
jgi:SAM-dependent methyltransferase